MDKKAMSDRVLVALIILLVAGFVLIVIAQIISSEIREETDIEACRLSVLAQAQTRKVPVAGSSPKTLVPLDCPRRYLKIAEDKVTVNGKKSRDYDFDKLSSDEINHIFAEEFRLCWYKMAEGNSDVFENAVFFDSLTAFLGPAGIGGIEFPPNICLICSEIAFDEQLKGKSYDGLVDFLKTKNMPKEELKYFDYLVRKQPYPIWGLPYTHSFSEYVPWAETKTGKIDEQPISASQKYTIYFMAYKPNWLSQFTNKYTKAYFIGLGTEDTFAKECDEQVN